MSNYDNPHVGSKWSDLRNTLLTPNERADIEARVTAITSMINARNNTDPFYSRTNMAVLRKSIAEANAGKFVVKTLERT